MNNKYTTLKLFAGYILVLALLPTMLFSQTQINIEFNFDGYADETTWDIIDSYGVTIATGGSYANGQPTAVELVDSVPFGSYTFNLYDSYGDGLSYPTDGWCSVTDSCSLADTLAFVMGDFGALYTKTLTIAPCAPPIGGCLDPLATNYDPTATINDSSCIYPPCTGLDTLWVESFCSGGDVTVYYHWTNMPNPSCRMTSYTRVKNINDLGNVWLPYPSNWSNTAIIYNGQQPNTTYYFIGMLADSTYTDTLVITTPDCIPGCMDPTALNYNPWANSNDGSCQAPPANCVGGESNIVITITPDTYVGETSWILSDTSGNILATSPSYTTTGVPVITEVCVPNGTVIEFTLLDSFGDGLCGSCYGGVDGSAMVQTLCGDTIFEISSPNANFGADTSVTYSVTPCIINAILGCTTPGFTEYNSLATQDDSTCLTPIILGCVDPTSPDYDPSANTMDIIPNCNYTLVITDAAQDGWFGAWLGVLQDTTTFGPFMMGPLDGASESFTISLSALSPVNIMFFAPGNSSTTSQQCGFYLISPEGDTTLSGGTNAWLDPMIQFPYKYKETPDCGDYCTDGIVGCMDPTAFNYNNSANMPDICIPVVLGCTNDLAFNYDSLANTDDNSCVPEVIGCMDSTAFNFSSAANTNDPLSCVPVIIGCMDATMFNYNAAANTTNNNCIPIVYGCIDSTAFNFNIAANTNNGSCISITLGCTDPTQFNFNILANVNDGTCIPFIYGCTDLTAFNYDPLANTNVGCISFVYGCIDPTAFNFNPAANISDNSCIPLIYGCMDNTAFNYNILANTDNGSCIPVVFGCTDSTQFNYDALANTDNGSCIAFIYGCTDATALNYNPLANTNDNSCIPFIYGCTDPVMFNYNPLANTDNGSCIPFVYGCTDAAAFNYNPAANTNDNTCCLIAGCTDINALNYNQFACFDDNSCITPISGCTDVAAYNYNPAANVTDTAACNYDAGCYGGPGIPYWLNDGCYAWVIDVDDYCCTNDWDASCVQMYDYCQLGWPTSVEDISALGIIVYPNPTSDIITIETRLEIEVEVYDIMGKLLISKDSKRIDLSEYSNGIYNLILIYNNKRFNTKVIKQ
jgi:hypothetical protein